MNSKEYQTATQVNMIHCELFRLWLAKWKTRSLSVFELAIVDPIDASPISSEPLGSFKTRALRFCSKCSETAVLPRQVLVGAPAISIVIFHHAKVDMKRKQHQASKQVQALCSMFNNRLTLQNTFIHYTIIIHSLGLLEALNWKHPSKPSARHVLRGQRAVKQWDHRLLLSAFQTLVAKSPLDFLHLISSYLLSTLGPNRMAMAPLGWPLHYHP